MGDFFVHPQGICESETVGPGTRIWAFAHVLPGARIGAECNLCDGVFVESEVVVGDRVTIKSGVQLWDGVELEDDVFVGPNATFTNDRFPRSRRWLEEYPRTIVREGASIGANATILPGIEVGSHAMVGAGAVVTHSVPAHAIVVGNPARITGYADADVPTPESSEGTKIGIEPLNVRGVHLRRSPRFYDMRGSLTAGEAPDEGVPFVPRRWFLVYDVPGREIRGAHAHRTCEQFLICVHGSVRVAVDDGERRAEATLADPTEGIYVPPMVWASQFHYEKDAVLLVLASLPYEPEDYIRDYGEFLAEAG